MKILLTGKNGQVGWELERSLQPLGQIFSFDRAGLDLANPDSIRAIIREVKPDLIVNSAAYTAVDKAEAEPDLAMAVNGLAPGIMAEEAKRLSAAIIHYSTDYVFDGTKAEPYTEDDVPNPINVYGKTKLAGEQAIQAVSVPHLIFRTSWVYGLRGKNFLLTILRLAKERDELRIVDDQFGAPTWCRTIAECTAQILAQSFSPMTQGASSIADLSGIYHLTAGGHTSWFGFTEAILQIFPFNGTRVAKTITPISASQYPLPAARPANSVLLTQRLSREFNLIAPEWSVALKLCCDSLRDGSAHC